MMQLVKLYKTKGEIFQFYKVNEVAKFATFAGCAKYFAELYWSNVFFEQLLWLLKLNYNNLMTVCKMNLLKSFLLKGCQIWFGMERGPLSPLVILHPGVLRARQFHTQTSLATLSPENPYYFLSKFCFRSAPITLKNKCWLVFSFWKTI